MRALHWLVRLLQRVWRWVTQRYRLLKPTWFATGLSVVIFILLQNGQTLDVLKEAVTGETALTSLYGGAALYSLFAWYFSRALLYVPYEATPVRFDVGAEALSDEERRLCWWLALYPRLLGLVVPLGLVVAFATLGLYRWAGIAAGLGLGLYVFFALRRAVLLKQRFWIAALWTVPEPTRRDALPTMTWRALLLILSATFLLAAALMISKTWLPIRIGAVGLVFLAAGSWIAFANVLLIYPSQRLRLPSLFALLVLFALLISNLNDNHVLRGVGDPPPADRRPEATRNAVDWLEARREVIADFVTRTGKPYPIVVVATEGGGIRAAYWTALVLAKLEQAAPGFACHVYAISGVSGGSLGAAVYAAELADRSGGFDCSGPGGGPGADFGVRMTDMLATDFLSPVLAGLLYPDLMQRFVPGPLFPDRAEYLERSWEAGWRAAHDDTSNRFDEPFLDLWWGSAARRLQVPSLLLNGTGVETGHRIVTTNLRLTGPTDGGPFAQTRDLFAVIDRNIRLSTAALNSARFPYVAPAGTLPLVDPEQLPNCTDRAKQRLGKDTWQKTVCAAQRPRQRIVDGGYFENSGARTGRQVLASLNGALRQAGGGRFRHRTTTVALFIMNDPDKAGTMATDLELLDAGLPASRPQGRLSEALSPLTAFANSRGGHGRLAETAMATAARVALVASLNPSPELRAKVTEPPLGWMLSVESQCLMRAQVDRLAILGDVRALFGATGPDRSMAALLGRAEQPNPLCDPR